MTQPVRAGRGVTVTARMTPRIGIVARDVNALGRSLENFKEPLTRSVRKVIIPSIRKNFDAGGRPAWKPLSEVTQTFRGEVGPILIRTGRLRTVATRFSIWNIDNKEAAVRRLPQEAWYGALHQAGFESSSARIPQRRFIMFQTPKDEDDISDIFFHWMSRQVQTKGGFKNIS